MPAHHHIGEIVRKGQSVQVGVNEGDARVVELAADGEAVLVVSGELAPFTAAPRTVAIRFGTRSKRFLECTSMSDQADRAAYLSRTNLL